MLGDHVTQKRSLVEPSRLRFDFSHMKPIATEEIDKVENFVNSMVSKKSDVKTRLMTPDEAVENGALALFGEKYGDEVRVLSMGDEDDNYFSTELCGWPFRGARRLRPCIFDRPRTRGNSPRHSERRPGTGHLLPMPTRYCWC